PAVADPVRRPRVAVGGTATPRVTFFARGGQARVDLRLEAAIPGAAAAFGRRVVPRWSHREPGHALRLRRLGRARRVPLLRRRRPRALSPGSGVVLRADGAERDRRNARARVRAEIAARRVPE